MRNENNDNVHGVAELFHTSYIDVMYMFDKTLSKSIILMYSGKYTSQIGLVNVTLNF